MVQACCDDKTQRENKNKAKKNDISRSVEIIFLHKVNPWTKWYYFKGRYRYCTLVNWSRSRVGFDPLWVLPTSHGLHFHMRIIRARSQGCTILSVHATTDGTPTYGTRESRVSSLADDMDLVREILFSSFHPLDERDKKSEYYFSLV